jgi:hypothetical protein
MDYDSSKKSPPVTHDATIRIIMVLAIIFEWSAQWVEVKGAFMCGNLKDGEEIYMKCSDFTIANNVWIKTSGNCILEKTCEGFD